MPLNDEQARDERLILRDRGVGRDIGRNPLFDPDRPRTRTENRRAATDTLRAVGGFGQRTESIVSYAATAVGFGLVPGVQPVINGAGAFHGISALYLDVDPASTGVVYVLVSSGSSPICQLALRHGIPAALSIPQGVNINGLSIECIWTGAVAISRSSAAIWAATVE